jgi:hypothetical protein
MNLRIVPLLAALVAALALTASPALAKGGSGGGGGGGSTAPAPAPTPEPVFVDPCEGYWDLPAYDDGSLPLVNRTNGGCVIIKAAVTGNTLDRVILLPGWTYTVVSNGGGTNSRVQVDFLNPTTGQKASIRVEAGKTDIR